MTEPRKRTVVYRVGALIMAAVALSITGLLVSALIAGSVWIWAQVL